MENYYNNSNYKAKPVGNSVEVSSFMKRVYFIMAAGLAITGLTAMFFFQNIQNFMGLFKPPMIWVIIFAPLALVFVLSAGIKKMNYMTATLVFAFYSFVNGISFTTIFFAYTAASIYQTFFITAGMFAGLAFLGTVTKIDLSKMGSILYMALFGLIIAMLVNFFFHSTMIDLVISIAGVIIFTGLTAYDAQKIKQMSAYYSGDGEMAKKASILGALTLYLDFINLFLFLLRFLGKRD